MLPRSGCPGGRLLLPGAARVRRTSGGAAAPCGRPGSRLLLPGAARVRHTSGGAAVPCGRPGGLLQPPGVTGVRRTPGGAAASWASRRPPSAAGDGGSQTHARRCCCALWASWRPPSAARGGEGQAHVRRHCCALWAAWRPPSAAGGDGVRRTHGCAAASWASRRPPSAHARHRAGARRRDCPGPPRVAEKPVLAVFRRGVGRETLRHSLQRRATAWSSCVRIGHAVSPDSKKGHTTKTPAGILSQIAVTIAAMIAPPVRRAVRARAVLIYFMLACGRHPGKPFRRVSLCPFLKLYLTTSKKQGVRLAVLLILHPGNWPGLCT